MAMILDVIRGLLNRKANGWSPPPYKKGNKFSNCSKFSLRNKQKQKGEKQ
jgi:hypothetical protein